MSERPLVEVYGIEYPGDVSGGETYGSREEAAHDMDPGGAVVPFIAANRLTDLGLPETLAELIVVRLMADGREDLTVQDVLVALRAHLESQ